MLRLPAALPAALRCLRLAVPPGCSSVRSRGGTEHRVSRGPGRIGHPDVRGPGFSGGDDRASQVPGGPPRTCPALKTPTGPRRQANTTPRCGLPLFVQRRLPRVSSYEAQSHGPCIRCLRFAGRITPPPRKTRFWLLARLYQAGLVTRRVPTKGFRMSHNMTSSFPRLFLAQTKRT